MRQGMSGQEYISRERLELALNSMDQVRAGVLGDFCMDIYWHADMTRSVLSRETPHFPLPVISEVASPGAAGNVAANIAALKPKSLTVLGVIGKDWRGNMLKAALDNLGVKNRLIESDGRVTNAYIKPMLHGYGEAVQEAARLDFENDQAISAWAEDQLIEAIEAAAKELDVLCVCDQMVNGCVTARVRECVMRLSQNGLKVIADSRSNIALYQQVIVKPNELEAANALDGMNNPETACRMLAQRNGRPTIVTVGEQGCYLSDGQSVQHIEAYPAKPPFDICGAGDTFLSAFACAYGGGAELSDAARLGNMASSVTIRKLGMTGTASREEIRAICCFSE